MHASSYEHMRRLVDAHLQPSSPLAVVDIGSYDVNGSYRTLFTDPAWRYTGVDLESGPGVDVVLHSPYRLPFATSSVDLVVSGQAFEHVEFFWLSWLEMLRVLKPGGRVFLIAPSRGPEHRYPQDCWRFYPDGYRALAKFGSCDLLQVSTDWEPDSDPGSAAWGDTVGVFVKRPLRPREYAFQTAMRLAGRLIPGGGR
ncbi:class I SAM-dependent methyltransferase [Cognatilysobacter terrigena]|uniref:class I SAM-dependent methyltransferase n=1 Tax=Cognatilysobacter terrigena TaxID=2488749 RepID=UPI00105E1003|nr:class I SAM-dependent methyltransferase [Lysobacter terrigena]